MAVPKKKKKNVKKGVSISFALEDDCNSNSNKVGNGFVFFLFQEEEEEEECRGRLRQLEESIEAQPEDSSLRFELVNLVLDLVLVLRRVDDDAFIHPLI